MRAARVLPEVAAISMPLHALRSATFDAARYAHATRATRLPCLEFIVTVVDMLTF